MGIKQQVHCTESLCLKKLVHDGIGRFARQQRDDDNGDDRSRDGPDEGLQTKAVNPVERIDEARLEGMVAPMPSARDRRTGLRVNARAYCQPIIAEAFVAGTEPTELCSVYEHQRRRTPYSFQRYPLGDHGELLIPTWELDLLLAGEPHARLVDRARTLEIRLPQETVSIPIRLTDGERPVPDPRFGPLETATWVGTDGRPARVVWMDGSTHPPPG